MCKSSSNASFDGDFLINTMKKIFLMVIALVIVFVLSNTMDFFTSIIPGWHTTVYPLWVIAAFLLLFFVFI
ncbi:hypothetical protein [Flavobacterium sp. UBA6135]|uniref:hypothetical protein n=1 Tax=Flavobacterium sp. UBA6135 TaxID=1946553 RepID=UPI0025BC395A|nr:hypothetical protein [Flavobacterium sp. UBA6135]